MRVVAHIIVKLITEIISACVFPTSLREMSENYRNRWIGHDKNPIQSTRIASLLLVTGADQFDRACIAAARTLRCVDLSWVVRPKQRFVLTLSARWDFGNMGPCPSERSWFAPKITWGNYCSDMQLQGYQNKEQELQCCPDENERQRLQKNTASWQRRCENCLPKQQLANE